MNTFLPVHRLFGGLLVLMLTAFSVWACFGRLDIVVSGTGKLVPVSFVQVSQPVESGPVVEVLVRDGQKVRAGQTLFRMDSVAAKADLSQQLAEASHLRLRILRILAEEADREFVPPEDLRDFAVAELADYRYRREAYLAAKRDAEFAVRKASSDLAAAEKRLEKLRHTSKIAADQADSLDKLDASGLVAHTQAQDKLSAKLDLSGELMAQKELVASARFAEQQAAASLLRVTADYHKSLGQERADAESALEKALSEVKKREHQVAESTLVAPVGGYVTGLVVKTKGQVVQVGTPLLSIVPENEPLQVEGWLKNEDAPYVAPGMPVKVKLAAYPFQKYGWLEGEVTWIGADSEVPESMKTVQGEPLFYRVRVALKQQSLSRDGKLYPAKPGMQVVADVQIGNRTLLEYLISPIKKVLLDAAREK